MNQEQPIRVVVKQKGGPGCFKIGLGVGCVAPAAFCVGLVVIAVIVMALVQAGEKSATEEAVKRNNGFGSFEKPISVQQWAVFEKGTVRATRLIRQADQMVEEFNTFNPNPPAGADYALVWFELQCNVERCDPDLLDLRLMDSQEKAWGEPWVLVLDSDFDKAALRGATTAGWQGFQFPVGETVRTIKIEWGSETLHVEPPAAQTAP